MVILKKVQEIINKYNLKPIDLNGKYSNLYNLIRENPDERKKYSSEKNDTYLFNKYEKHIPNGWYGFEIGSPIIPEWIEIIDEILILCIETDPEFNIHQIKLKYGGVRFYVESAVIEDLFEVEMLIDNTLYDKALIY